MALSELINQAVGDALSDMLLVEVVLAHRGWGAPEWDAGYEDLPNRLVKVEVPDRGLFETEDAERRLKFPEGLQARIDAAVKKVDMGRSFVRPSGTEDCVRVYAEAKTSPDAEGEFPKTLRSLLHKLTYSSRFKRYGDGQGRQWACLNGQSIKGKVSPRYCINVHGMQRCNDQSV